MQIKNLGTITGVKGQDGAFVVSGYPLPLGDIPAGIKIKIGLSQNFLREYIIESHYVDSKGRNEFKLRSVNDATAAKLLKEQAVYIERSEIEKFNEVYLFNEDLLGCTVIDDETDEVLGELIEIWNMPANDVWLVLTNRGELTVPAIEEFVRDIDIEAKKIRIFVMPGLLDLLDKSQQPDDAGEGDED